jgi:cell division protease FtsH
MVLEKKQNSFLGGGLSSSREFSEETAQKVDNFIKTQLDERYKIVKNKIEKYRDAIENMVSALYKTETLTGADVRRIIGDFEKEQGYETMLQSNKSEETQKDEVKKDLNLEKTSSEKTDLNE